MNEYKSPDNPVCNSSSGGRGAPCCMYTHVFTCLYIKEGRGGGGCQRAKTPALCCREQRLGREDDTAHQSGHRGQHRHPPLLWLLTASQPPPTQPDSPTRSRIPGKQDLTCSFSFQRSLGWNEEGDKRICKQAKTVWISGRERTEKEGKWGRRKTRGWRKRRPNIQDEGDDKGNTKWPDDRRPDRENIVKEEGEWEAEKRARWQKINYIWGKIFFNTQKKKIHWQKT